MMKRGAIVICVLLVIVMFGCVNSEVISGWGRPAFFTGCEGANGVLCVLPERIIFENEKEFIDAIQDAKGKDSILSGLSHYYVPVFIPEDVSLSDIHADNMVITFRYSPEKDDPHWENTFVVKWCRDDESAETKAKNCGESYTEYRGYYIIATEPWDGYQGEKEIINQHIYWEQDDQCFHAVVPSEFTEADIETYCVIKQIDVG